MTNTLSKFDSSLGTLTAVKLTLSGTATQIYTATNIATTQQNANITAATQMDFTLSDGITLSNPNNGQPAFTFSNNSGSLTYTPGQTRNFGPFQPNIAVDYLFPLNESVAKFLGGAGSTFSVACSTLSSLLVVGGGGNVQATQDTKAGCGALVEYTYTPAPPPQNVPEPSAVFGLGVLGLGAFLKRIFSVALWRLHHKVRNVGFNSDSTLDKTMQLHYHQDIVFLDRLRGRYGCNDRPMHRIHSY